MKLVYRLIACMALLGAIGACDAARQAESDNTPVASPGKPSAPISMAYQVLTKSPQPGQEIEIAVSFKSTQQSNINAQLQSAEKLTWVNAEKSWQSSPQKNGAWSSLPHLKVVAPQNGLYFIHMMASVELDGKLVYKPFTLAVQVGEPSTTNPNANIIEDENGEKLHVQQGDSHN